MKKKYAIHHMTWREVEDSFSKDPVVLIPLGSMEEHGPHSITGDFMAATEVAKRVAKESDALYIPTIPFGNSEYFRPYPGTISLSGDTVSRILLEVVESLTEHGVKRIMFVNGHAGNAPNIDYVARKLQREKGLTIVSINLWQSLTDEFKKELYKEETDPSGHGGEPLTSIMMHLFPEDMRMDLLPDSFELKDWQGTQVKTLTSVQIKETSASVFLNMDDMTNDGISGNPTHASKERGEKILNQIVKNGTDIVEWLKKIETQKKKKE